MKDLSGFIGTLPYASELFGIYQPLLGWKSQIVAKRIDASLVRAFSVIADTVLNRVRAPITVHIEGEHELMAGRFLNAPFRIEGLRIAVATSASLDGFAPSDGVHRRNPDLSLATKADGLIC